MKREPPELPQEPCSTIDLVVEVQRGRDHAMTELFDRCSPRLRHFVRRKLGPMLRQRVESTDIVLTAFAQAARNIGDFEPRNDRSWINYLCKIAEHQIWEELRYQQAGRRTPDREVPLDAPDGVALFLSPQNDKTPSQAHARDELSKTIRDCIAALPKSCRESIILRCFCNASFDEIAKFTNRPTAAAAGVFHRNTAIKELSEQLRNRGVSAVDLPR